MARGGQLEPVLTINWPDSLGLFYAVFTGFLGFVPNSGRMEGHGTRSLRQARRRSPHVHRSAGRSL